MRTLNRSAVVVRYREPYLRWAAQAFPGESADAESLRDDLSVYLVPPDSTEEQESAPLEDFFEAIFEHELENWCTDRARWPEQRDLAMFLAWFDVTVQSVVVDLAPERIRTEPF